MKQNIYEYLKNGGKSEDLEKAFYNDLLKAQNRIESEEKLEAEKKVREQKRLELKNKAVDALLEYAKFCETTQTKERDGYTKEDFSSLVSAIGTTDIAPGDKWLLDVIHCIFNF